MSHEIDKRTLIDRRPLFRGVFSETEVGTTTVERVTLDGKTGPVSGTEVTAKLHGEENVIFKRTTVTPSFWSEGINGFISTLIVNHQARKHLRGQQKAEKAQQPKKPGRATR